MTAESPMQIDRGAAFRRASHEASREGIEMTVTEIRRSQRDARRRLGRRRGYKAPRRQARRATPRARRTRAGRIRLRAASMGDPPEPPHNSRVGGARSPAEASQQFRPVSGDKDREASHASCSRSRP